jgi:Fe-S oxidoreductase
VVLFLDTYARYYDPALGRHAVELLTGTGYTVHPIARGCCQRPRISQGLLDEAKLRAAPLVAELDAAGGGDASGVPILCLEPSCASSLKDDLPDLLEDADAAKRVADRVQLLDAFLLAEGVELRAAEGVDDVLVHAHCHQRAVFDGAATATLLDGTAGVSCRDTSAGCCGMAGAFGYQHHDLSMQIAEDRLLPAARDALAAGRTVAAPGFSCRHQLADALEIDLPPHPLMLLRV